MTTQEALDAMVAHFSQPGTRLGMEDPHECVYRGSDGQRCAVGCLIPNELYASEFEGNSARMFEDVTEFEREEEIELSATALNKARAIGELLAGVDVQFLMDAQNKHDNSDSVSMFLARLEEVAKDHNLRWTA